MFFLAMTVIRFSLLKESWLYRLNILSVRLTLLPRALMKCVNVQAVSEYLWKS